ncbi:MAG: sensor histidine kinase [Faecalibacterium sp.]
MSDTTLLRLCLAFCHMGEYSILYKTDQVLLPKGKLSPRMHAVIIALLFFVARFLVLWDEHTLMTPLCICTDALLFSATAFCFGGTFRQKFVSSVIGSILVVALENMTHELEAQLFHRPALEVLLRPQMALLNAFLFTFYGELARMVLSQIVKHQRIPLPQWGVTLFYPCMALSVSCLLILLNKRIDAPGMLIWISIALLVSLVAHFEMVRRLNEETARSEQAHLQIALEQERAEALMESYTAQRRLTHEFTHHLDALNAFLQKENLEGAKAYLASVSRSVASGTTILNTGNPLLDALLSRQYQDAAGRGVLLYFDLCNLQHVPFADQDLVILISNLMGNAVEAACGCDRPEVFLRIKICGGELLLSVRNRVSKDIPVVDGQLPHTTKQEPGHGMGLVNVQDVLRKYDAEYTISCRDRWFRFTCAVRTDNL